jgi:hypothetical protein
MGSSRSRTTARSSSKRSASCRYGSGAKLQRIIRTREFVKVGGSRLIRADIRLVTASNRDVRRAVDDGSFQKDLFYRISVAEDDGGPSSGSAQGSLRRVQSAERLSRPPSGPRSTRRADRVDLEFSLVLENSRFGLDPRAARVTWTILVFLAALGLGYAVRRVLFLVALSLFFAYLLFPLVRLAQQWVRHSRPLAIAVVSLVVLAVLGGAGIAVGPRLATEVQDLAQKLPETSKRIQNGEIEDGSRSRSARSTGWCRAAWERSSATPSRPRRRC